MAKQITASRVESSDDGGAVNSETNPTRAVSPTQLEAILGQVTQIAGRYANNQRVQSAIDDLKVDHKHCRAGGGRGFSEGKHKRKRRDGDNSQMPPGRRHKYSFLNQEYDKAVELLGTVLHQARSSRCVAAPSNHRDLPGPARLIWIR